MKSIKSAYEMKFHLTPPPPLRKYSENIKPIKILITAAVIIFLFGFSVMPVIADDFSGGDGTQENPYNISNAGDLENLSINVNIGKTSYKDNYFSVTSDIDLSGKDWIPIGNINANAFKGNFDGGGKTISNLYINNPNEVRIGLFGYTDNANFTNVYLTNVSIIGKNSVGGLIGENSIDIGTHSVYNCSVSGIIKGVLNVGGLIGQNTVSNSSNHFIDNCSFSVKVSGTQQVGGIIGYNQVYSGGIITITNCYAITDVNGNQQVGGLIGKNYLAQDDNIKTTITNCYAIADVKGTTNVGGIVGWNTGGGKILITNCYTIGDVNGTNYIGGLIGRDNNNKNTEVMNSTALNQYVNCSDPNSVGRIVGYVIGTNTITLSHNYGWNGMKNYSNPFTTETKLDQKNGKNISNTDAWCSKSFFEDTLHWDFDNTWSIAETDDGITYPLPYLKSLGKDDSLREKVIYLMPDYEVSVKFNNNSGTGTMSDQEFQYGVRKSLTKNKFTRTGYKFIGWNTSAEGTDVNYEDGQSIIITAETTLYAVWKGNLTNITLYFNNTASSSKNQVVNISYDSGEFNKTLLKPIYEGHTFLGYYNSTGLNKVKVIEPDSQLVSDAVNYTSGSRWINESSDISLYAVWKENPAAEPSYDDDNYYDDEEDLTAEPTPASTPTQNSAITPTPTPIITQTKSGFTEVVPISEDKTQADFIQSKVVTSVTAPESVRGNITITIQSEDDEIDIWRPADTEDVYEFDVSADDEVESELITIHFVIYKYVLDELGLMPEDVGLRHFENGRWVELNTSYVIGDDGIIYYSAVTYSLSPFEIFFKKSAAKPVEVKPKTPTEETPQSPMPVLGLLMGLCVTALVLRRK